MRLIPALILIAVLAASSLTHYTVRSAQSQTITDDLATAQAAITTAQARLATIPPTAAVVPPTATLAPTVAPTATPGDRVIRGTRVPTETPQARPTATPTIPPAPTPTPDPANPGPLNTYRSLAVIPTTYQIDGVTTILTQPQIDAAVREAQSLEVKSLDYSRGMGRITVTVVVSTIPVTTYREFCGSGGACGRWIAPEDIRDELTAQGAGRYDFVHSYVPSTVMTCPCSGIAIPRYFSDRLVGTQFVTTTQLHETGHVIGDFWLRSQGYDNLPVCDGDGWPMHCGYVMGGANLTWMRGYFSGTLVNGWGIDQRGWLMRSPTGDARAEGEALDEYPWTGRELPVSSDAEGGHDHGRGAA